MTGNKLNRLSINRNSVGFFVIGVFISYFVFFFIYGGVMSYSIRHMATNKEENNKYELSFGTVSTKGFLMTNTKIKNIELLGRFENGRVVKIALKQLNIKSIPFSKHYAIVINDDIKLITNTTTGGESIINIKPPKNFTIQFNLTKNNQVKNIFTTADKITLSDQDEKDIVDLFSVSFERYMLVLENSIESILRLNIDNIIETEKTEKDINRYENNLETVITVSTKFSEENNSTISNDIKINKFVLNDISNNFGFEIDGNYNSNFITKNTIMDFLLKVVNYNSMLRAINNKNHFVMIDTKLLSQIMEILSLSPHNYRNTKFDKYYSIKYNRSQKSITVNNEAIENLIKKNFVF